MGRWCNRRPNWISRSLLLKHCGGLSSSSKAPEKLISSVRYNRSVKVVVFRQENGVLTKEQRKSILLNIFRGASGLPASWLSQSPVYATETQYVTRSKHKPQPECNQRLENWISSICRSGQEVKPESGGQLTDGRSNQKQMLPTVRKITNQRHLFVFYRTHAASDFNVSMPSPQLGVGGGKEEGDSINISINVSKSAFEI